MKTMNSIFQGAVDIRKVIAETLGLSKDDKNKYDYTYPIYHTAFFYLQKRFGVSKNYDEDKEAGRWILEFKGVQFLFSFHSDVVEIWVLGSKKEYLSYDSTPYQRAYTRTLRKSDFIELYPFDLNLTPKELELYNKEVFNFFGTENPPEEEIENKLDEWLDYAYSYNLKNGNELFEKLSKYTKEQYIEFEDKYGRCNSHHRYLLRVLKKLLKAFMQEPVWVRDVPFNIKGRMEINDVKRDYLDIKLVKK